MNAELTRFTGDQRGATGEEATTCITQCTGKLGCHLIVTKSCYINAIMQSELFYTSLHYIITYTCVLKSTG